MNYLKEVSERNDIDLKSCGEIARDASKNVVELTDKSTGCVTKRMVQIVDSMKPLQIESDKTMSIMSSIWKANSDCVSDPDKPVMQNLACLNVSKIRKFEKFKVKI